MDTTPEKAFTANLRRARRARHYSQRALAIELVRQGHPHYVSFGVVAKIERGSQRPSLDFAVAVSDLLGFPLADMLTPDGIA